MKKLTTPEPIKEKKVRKPKPKKRESTIRLHNAGTWSDAEYFGKIRSGLRKIFQYWKPIQLALKKASRPSQSDNKRLKTEYECNHCKNWFPRKLVEVNHIEPLGSLRTYDDIVPFIQRLAIEDVDKLNVLCKPCHLAETKLQRQLNLEKNEND